MDSRYLAFFIVLVSASPALAWSDYTNQYLCDNAVKGVWGEKVFNECLGAIDSQYQTNYCQMLEGEKKAACEGIRGVVHPAELPNLIGEDDLQQAAPECPIARYPAKVYLCATKNESLKRAKYWMNQSINADTRCGRIYLFCVTSNYLAQAYNPFNYVLGEESECKSRMNKKIDFDLRMNQSSWGVTEYCTFDYPTSNVGSGIKGAYSQEITINDKIIGRAVENLTREARGIYTLPLGQPKVTTTTTLPQPANVTKEKDYCIASSDCALVQSDCCGCNEGGENIAVSNEYKPTWDRQIGEKCKETACVAAMSQHISCYSTAVCVNNKCTLKPDTAKLCGNPDIKADCAAEVQTTIPGESAEHGVSCGYINYLCREQGWGIPTTTTTTTSTTMQVTSTTSAPTTTIPPKKEEGTSPMMYAIGFIALVGILYLAYTFWGEMGKAAGAEPLRRTGLRKFGASDVKIASSGGTRLNEADRTPKTKGGDKSYEIQQPAIEARPPEPTAPRETGTTPKKSLLRSLLKHEKEGTKLGSK